MLELLQKYEMVKSMDAIVKTLKISENYYKAWNSIISKNAGADDFIKIIKDDRLVEDVVILFIIIMLTYMDEGFHINEKIC